MKRLEIFRRLSWLQIFHNCIINSLLKGNNYIMFLYCIRWSVLPSLRCELRIVYLSTSIIENKTYVRDEKHDHNHNMYSFERQEFSHLDCSTTLTELQHTIMNKECLIFWSGWQWLIHFGVWSAEFKDAWLHCWFARKTNLCSGAVGFHFHSCDAP